MRRILTLALLVDISAGAQAAQSQDRRDEKPAQWQRLFDGRSLGQWRETPFTGRGMVRVDNQAVVLGAGEPMTGITYGGDLPKTDYEVRFEATKITGGDFFASLTFTAGTSFCTWVLGGWGGDIVGISSVDGWDASENETRTYFSFEPNRWYKFRLHVTENKITGFIDDAPVTVLNVNGRPLTLRRGEIRLSAPLGFASYRTTGMVRNIEIRALRPH